MSVSRICVAGHTEMCRREGGTIIHLATGQDMKLHGVDRVNRYKATAKGEDSGFIRQGRSCLRKRLGHP